MRSGFRYLSTTHRISPHYELNSHLGWLEQVLETFAHWARATAADAELHAMVVRAQGWLLRHVVPAPRFRGTLVEPRLYVGSLQDAHSVHDLQDRRVRSILTAAAEQREGKQEL